MQIEDYRTGDFVFIHMRADLDIEEDGPTMRVGHITRIGSDLFGEPMLALDDGYPPLYLCHARDISNHGQRAAAV